MKNQLINRFFMYLILGLIICGLLILPETWIVKLITQNNPENFKTCLIIMEIITFGVYFIILIIKAFQYQKSVERYLQERVEEVEKELSSEFKTVLLKRSGDISKEMFECKARVNDDGKIICKIHVDFETEIDSYEDFIRYFRLNE